MNRSLSLWVCILLTACDTSPSREAPPLTVQPEQGKVTQEPATESIPPAPPGISGPIAIEEEVQKEPPSESVDAAEARRREVVSQLWSSPTGRLFKSFMIDDLSRNAVIEHSREIALRVFKSSAQSITYVSALQLLAEDLYHQGKIGDEQKTRLLFLRGDLAEAQIASQKISGRHQIYYPLAALLAALPLGSPQIRHTLKHWVRALLGGRFFPEAPAGIPAAEMTLGRLASDYRIRDALKSLFTYFGAFTMAYFYWYDWRERPKGELIERTIVNLQNPERYEAFLKALATL